MDFTFSAEQDALRDSVRAVLREADDGGRVRAIVDGDQATAAAGVAALWSQFAELGWPALLVPESAGGLGLGFVDAVVVLEEMGRVTLPGPFLSSSVCATTAARLLGLHDVLPALAAGTTTGTVALEELGHDDPVERVRTRAVRTGGRWVLHGHKPVVLDGAAADWILVAARTQEGLGTFLLEASAAGDANGTGSIAEPVPTMDPTRQVASLHLEATPAEPVGPAGDHTSIWRTVADVSALALAAELVGVGDAALEASITYTGARVQFDVPLSSHQVIQHKLVDMLHQLEMGRVGVHYAAWAADVDAPDRGRAAAIAKASMGEAAVAITADAIQVHGAVGFTWDADPQLLYKRAKQNDVLAGSAAWHRRRVADSILSVIP